MSNEAQAIEVAQRARADGYDFEDLQPGARDGARRAGGGRPGRRPRPDRSFVADLLSDAITHGQVMVAHSPAEFLRLLTGSSTAALDAVAQQAAAAGVTVTATLYVGEVSATTALPRSGAAISTSC
ncbi:MAG: hypothetical protein R2882_13205 [Gemmatimonadales bacterium]